MYEERITSQDAKYYKELYQMIGRTSHSPIVSLPVLRPVLIWVYGENVDKVSF